ncbi:MAG: hypothetical protein M1504_02245 [Candidatus Marsarchaeota archaeon]|nr:hypothetical protein [Candidatus Marsarchaeota archaeon]
MAKVEINVEFVPGKLKAFTKNETQMTIVFKSADKDQTYWVECDVVVTPPLSLAYDSEMNMGRTRIGLLKPDSTLSKLVRLYTRPNNYPDDYKLNVVAYVYDEDGAIAERLERPVSIVCVEKETA